jgi:hypothetical protein
VGKDCRDDLAKALKSTDRLREEGDPAMTAKLSLIAILSLASIAAEGQDVSRNFYEVTLNFLTRYQDPDGGRRDYNANFAVRYSDDGYCFIYTYGGRRYPCTANATPGNPSCFNEIRFSSQVSTALGVDAINAAMGGSRSSQARINRAEEVKAFIMDHRRDSSARLVYNTETRAVTMVGNSRVTDGPTSVNYILSSTTGHCGAPADAPRKNPEEPSPNAHGHDHSVESRSDGAEASE